MASPRGTSALSPGQVLLEKYRVERVLGRGGMGVVYAAHHILLDRPVALKLLAADAAMQNDARARFLNEARNAARVDNDYVCRVMDLGVLPSGQPYIAMELLDGTDLGRLLAARGPLPIVEAVGYVIHALTGIGTAHLMGIVHRDLKPSNLFVAKKPGGGSIVKVLDFGISKAQTGMGPANVSAVNNPLGSPAYMSPEQVSLSPTIDARADLWAVGVILYELLTGKLPFEGNTVPEALAFILEREPAPPSSLRPDVPRGLEAVIAHCLAKDPAQRFADAAALAAALGPFGPWASNPLREAPPASANAVGTSPDRASIPDTSTLTRGVWTQKSRSDGRAAGTPYLKMVGIGASIGVMLLAVLVAVSWGQKGHEAGPSATASASAAAATNASSTSEPATTATETQAEAVSAAASPAPEPTATATATATEASAPRPLGPGRRPALSRQRR
jgi:serine/threonine-protein kinase